MIIAPSHKVLDTLHKVVSVTTIVLSVCLLLTSCYHSQSHKSGALAPYSKKQQDSLSFFVTHHYTNNYNFVVKADSLVLLRQQPEELISELPTDSVVVRKHNHLVVADIRIIPTDSIDSVWVSVARDQSTMGWVRESKLLSAVDPDDPISQFISTFSDTHLILFLIVISAIVFVFIVRRIMRKNAPIVHFRDIDSFYPTLLCLIVSASATFYASIQNFAPDLWRHFYFHPTLNPFAVPAILAVFLISVWAMLIVALAAIDEVRRMLPFDEALLYLCGLFAVCAVDYVIFSITTLYYIGYILLVVYGFFAIRQYYLHNRAFYICGNCGAKMRKKGRCPRCGALND